MRTRSLVAGFVMILAATAAQARPAEFLTKAMQGDNSETRLGAFAAERGASPGVRQFGQMLQRDHQRARRQAVAVASRHGVRPTDEMMPEAREEYRKLQGLRGRAFDREFARYMVQDHQKDIADFQKETASRDPADIRALARQTLPDLRKHLQVARSLTR